MILVLGATGTTGGEVARQLIKAGQRHGCWFAQHRERALSKAEQRSWRET